MSLLDYINKSFAEFLDRIFDAKAIADLEAICNDDDRMERWAAETPEWQPYPVPPRGDSNEYVE